MQCERCSLRHIVSSTGTGTACSAGAGKVFSPTGAGAAYPTGAVHPFATTGSGVASPGSAKTLTTATGTSAMYSFTGARAIVTHCGSWYEYSTTEDAAGAMYSTTGAGAEQHAAGAMSTGALPRQHGSNNRCGVTCRRRRDVTWHRRGELNDRCRCSVHCRHKRRVINNR